MLNRATPVAVLVVLLASLCAYSQITPEAAARNGVAPDAMNTGGAITGAVRTIDDHGIENARVEVRDAANGSVLASTYSGVHGTFELYNIPSGTYEVVALQGVNESRERVTVSGVETPVNLRMAKSDGGVAGDSATVSVAQFKIPGKARKEFERGEKAFRENKLQESREHMNKALEIFPAYAEALVIRGIVSVQENDLQAGEVDLQNAIKYDPSYGMAYIAMGALMNQAKRYDEAKRTLQRGIAISPATWQGYFELSKASMGLQDFEAAVQNAARAEDLSNKQYAPIHLVKAHALVGLKRYDEAISEFEAFISRDPQNPNADSARQAISQAKAFVAKNGGGSK